MFSYLYSRWDGAQQVFDFDDEDLMEQLSEYLVNYSDISQSLDALAHRGLHGKYGQDVPGLEELLDRLHKHEQRILNRYNLDHILEDMEGRLRRIVDAERLGMEQRLREAQERLTGVDPNDTAAPTPEQISKMLKHLEQMTKRNRKFLEKLPSDPAGAIDQLRQYEFMDEQARSAFDDLQSSLEQKVLDASINELTAGFASGDQDQRNLLKEMLQELNHLIDEHLEGSSQSSRLMFDRFMQKYGQKFNLGNPSNMEELADLLHGQMCQMDMLLRSLSEEHRRQLEAAFNSVLQDAELQDEMSKLSQNLQRLSPGWDPSSAYDFSGDQNIGLERALELIADLNHMAELGGQIKKAQQGRSNSSVDMMLLKKYLGEEACQALEQLQSLAEILKRAGYLRNGGTRLELTPKGVRKIGQKALQEVFHVIRKDREGNHRTIEKGIGGDPTEDTHPYRFGDPFNLHLQRTIMNGVLRSPGTPVTLTPRDFEVQQLEQASQASTVLMLDLSLSMATRGNFPSAKKVALALDNLIRTQFPTDSLQIVGFSTYAREVKPEEVAYLTWDQFDSYTNIQHGLSTARKLLANSRGSAKQIIMISDGEPTAHIEGGELFSQFPPTPRTIRETLKEVKRCTRQGIMINMFMLDRNSALVEFVEQMTKINRGKVFYTSPNKLGEYILVDYLTSRRKLLA